MNRTQHKHLIGSKWTHLAPVDRDKHFVVLRVHEKTPSTEARTRLELQAILSKRTRQIEIEELQDETRWKPDWR